MTDDPNITDEELQQMETDECDQLEAEGFFDEPEQVTQLATNDE